MGHVSCQTYVRVRFDSKGNMQENRDKLRWQKITRLLGFAPDYWALHPTTAFFSPDYWAFHPTTGLFTRLLGFSFDYWAFTRLLGFYLNTGLLSEYWAFTRILGFHPNTGLLPECWAFIRILAFYLNTGLSPNSPNPIFRFHYAGPPSQIGHGHMYQGNATSRSCGLS